jgi:hypothetical protein
MEIWGLQLDYKENQGPLCKFPGIIDFGIIFELKNMWAWSTGRGPPEPQSTVDQPPLPAGGAHRSSAYSRFGALGRRPGAGEGEWSTGASMGCSLEAGQQ